MKFAVYFNLVSIYFHLTGADIGSEVLDYLSLMKYIHSHYSTSSVFILHPEKGINEKHFDDLLVQQIIFDWTRLFHRERIATVCGTYKDIARLTKHYANLRPLIIVFIPAERAVSEFARYTMDIKMSAFLWLVIFVPWSRKNELNYHCHYPRGNLFNLMFDSEMLVLCAGDPVIREWYSIDGKKTEIIDFLKWHRDGRSSPFEMLTNLSFLERRNNLRGKVLKAVIVKNSIFITLKNGKLAGSFSYLIEDLQNILNFTIGTITETEIFGIYNTTTGRWNGAFNLVASGEVDMSLCAFSMTNVRLGVVDFTTPITTASHYIYVKQPQAMAVKWFAYYRAFSFCLWMCIITIITITPFISTFIRSQVESTSAKQLLYDEFMRIWSIFCQQGITDIPRYSSLRITYIAMLITSIVMTSAYSGSLISFLTGSIHDVPFRTVDELLNDGSYRIIVERGTSDYDMFALSSDSLSKRVKKVLRPSDTLPISVPEGFQQICDNPNLGFYTAYRKDQQDFEDFIIPCKVSAIDFNRVDSYSLILPKHSQYTLIISYYLQKLMNSGVLSRRKMTMNSEMQTKFEPVGIFSAASALIIFAGGAALALIILLIELCYYYKIRASEIN